jgi:hypothetical protein
MGITVRGLHLRVIRAKGWASEWPCVSCKKTNTKKWCMDWSRIHGRSGRDIEDYEPMCRKCHMLYDRSTLKADDVIQIRELIADGHPQTQIAYIFNVSQMTIRRINTGQTWSHI